jgi:hypothetical protein
MKFVRINAGEPWCQNRIGVIVNNLPDRPKWMLHYELWVSFSGHPFDSYWDNQAYGFQSQEVIRL